ncbi:MAG: hypothetical protein JWL77_1771 [Chthonomonadaceae bacterium]|nr:hypothetical protein [Chthonomonadaceae bacterium]
MLFARSTAGTTVAVIALLFGREGHVTAQALPTRPFSPSLSSTSTSTGTKPLPHRKNVPLPMAFEASVGRTNRQDDFLSHGPGYRLTLSPDQATFQLAAISAQSRPSAKHPAGVSNRDSTPCETLAMRLLGADASAHAVQGAIPTGHANYFLGKDRSQWRTDIPLYDRVKYRQVYRGIDLVYYGNQSELEYDFLVRPGTDPNRIALKFTGARTVRIATNGDLVLGLRQREVRWHKPLTYQTIAGKKRMVASAFVLKKGGKVGFALARYDTSRSLTIDPKLIYSKTLGNGGIYPNSLVVDREGNTYVAGSLSDTDFPVTPGAFQTSRHGAFVAKLNPAGTAFLYATYLGGSGLPAIGSDIATGIALDSQGNAYVTGTTASQDFPITPGAFQTTNRESTEYVDLGHNANSFVTKLNATGSALIYSTYLGGHTGPGAADATTGIVVDSQGSAYVTGSAASADFPTTSGAYQPKRRSTQSFPGTGFVTKLNPAGTTLTYSTFLEGSQGSGCYGIALGSGGEVYVTGGTNSPDFPVTPKAFQKTNRKPASPEGNFNSTAFVTRLNSTGSSLVYSTFLGGSGKYGDAAYGIAVDPAGSAYVVGTTFSVDFPTTPGAFQQRATVTAYGVGGAFVTKLAPDGSSLLYSTYLGDGDGNAIAIDSTGNACIVGDEFGTGFPATVGAFPRPLNPTGIYAYIAKLNTTGTALLYSTYRADRQAASSIALDNRGNATICGPGFVERLSTNPVFPDFNNDGNTDLLLRNRNTGVVGTWFMNGADVVGGVTFSQIPPPTYNLVGVGDFRSDGSSTLVFQDSVDNRVVFWYTGGANTAIITGGDYVNQTPTAGWKVVGIADFNRDGRSDLVFQNQTTGQIAIWFMNGPVYQSGVQIPSTPGIDLQVVGTGDFNADGFADIVFQNRKTSQVTVWFMNAATYAGSGLLKSTLAPGWSVVGIGDYNGDGRADLLLQNQTTHQTVVWYLNGTFYQGGSVLSQSPPVDWNIAGPH